MNAKPPAAIFTSREFNQDTARAKKAAEKGPVFITSRGEVSHVLLSKEAFDRMEDGQAPAEKAFRSLADVLGDDRPEADFDFEFPEFKGSWSIKVPELD